PDGAGGWELVLARQGRLVAAERAVSGVHPVSVVEAMRTTAETLPSGVGPLPAASAEETECILRWLDRPGTRLVSVEGTLASPAYGAASMLRWLRGVETSRAAADPFADRRRLRTETRPSRIGAA
ncbi:MAG: endonuclease, partial [Actinomycetota bacterium]|nr:endonuclease [Actinomycetota bacterium]